MVGERVSGKEADLCTSFHAGNLPGVSRFALDTLVQELVGGVLFSFHYSVSDIQQQLHRQCELPSTGVPSSLLCPVLCILCV